MATEREVERGAALLASSRHTHLLASDFPACWVLGYGVPGDLGADGVSVSLYIDIGNREFWHSYHYRNESWRKSSVQPSSVAIERDRAITFEEDKRRAADLITARGYSSRLARYSRKDWRSGNMRSFGYGSPVELGIEAHPTRISIYADLSSGEVWTTRAPHNGVWEDHPEGWRMRQGKIQQVQTYACPNCKGTGLVEVIDQPDKKPPTRRILLQEETE